MRERAALALLVLVLLAGCSGILGDDSSLPSGEEAVEGYESLRGVDGTVEYVGGADGENLTARITLLPKRGMSRQHVVAPPDMAGDRYVSNGSVTWLYDASENSVTRVSIGNVSLSNTSDAAFLRRVFGNLSKSRDDPTIAVSALPVVPTGGGGKDALTTADLGGTTRLNLTYLGTETIAARRAYGVRLTPVNASGTIAGLIENVTYWFDAEYFYPLRTETVISIDGDHTRSGQIFRNVTFNPGIDADRFAFDPPANATIDDVSESRTGTFETVEAVRENVSFRIPEFDAPEGFALDTATVTRAEERTSVSLLYSNGSHDLSFSIRRPPPESTPTGEPLELAGTNATMTSFGDSTSIRWRCRGSGYAISGNLPAGELRELAWDVASACR